MANRLKKHTFQHLNAGDIRDDGSQERLIRMISVMAQPLQLLLPNKCQQIKKTTEKETRKCVSKECYQEREREIKRN